MLEYHTLYKRNFTFLKVPKCQHVALPNNIKLLNEMNEKYLSNESNICSWRLHLHRMLLNKSTLYALY